MKRLINIDRLLARKELLQDGIDCRHLGSYYEGDILDELVWSAKAAVEIDQITRMLDSLRIEEV